ncbi:MAG: DNA mismatch repair protein MutS [Sphingobacteriaceae bacterium]|nr:DNA mismatch repair protein MutS [Sphingobacteriaceae bacterium]
MSDSIINYYQHSAEKSRGEVNRYEKLVNTYSFLRLFSIILGGILIYQAIQLESIWLVELTFFLLMIGFAWLVKQQGGYERKKTFFTALKAVCENEISSIRSQGNLYQDGSQFEDDAHNYSSDLDVFGKASLFNLVNRSASPQGNEKLALWLRKSANEDEILQRQPAVKELAKKLDWVQEVKALLLFANGSDKKEIENLIAYFQSAQNPISQYLRIYIKAVPYIFLATAVGAWFIPVLSVALFVLALSNGILVLSNQLKVNRTDRILSKLGKTLSAYSEGLNKIESGNWKSDLLHSLAQKLNDNGSSFSLELKQLSILAGRLEYRLNMFVGMFLNGIAAWDVRQLIAIEDWRTKNRDLVPEAFEVLSSFEALISLSSLNSNYPEWCFPEILYGENYTYEASDLSHPLIPVHQRVSNDFQLIDTRKIDIITGSNMAGKSTFLRTLGINAVLAFAGAPVCATAMKITVMNLFAYMRIRDSLNESISTFKAELNRLQLLLDVLQHEKKVFFLIDEMLRGTNSVDKYRGSKAVVEKLISQNGVGAVATHDLQLARLEDKYPAYVRNFYFDIQVLDGEMLFDYKLKEGECKTFNASLLLKQIGINVED